MLTVKGIDGRFLLDLVRFERVLGASGRVGGLGRDGGGPVDDEFLRSLVHKSYISGSLARLVNE